MNYEGKEVFFDRDDLIVSKTDLKGHITYANHTFLEIAGYDEDEVIGKPHNLIRHGNMPRAVFELLWSNLQDGQEVFAYVVNSTKNGNHYWVIAHVTPSRENGEIIGYHSTRRVPNPRTVTNVIEPLYERLNGIEAGNSNRKVGTQDSVEALNAVLAEKGTEYDEFMSTLMKDD
jgi:PAS domain S-box-containing protein